MTHTPPLDPIAFFVALVTAPLAFTALSFWVLLIPVGALVLGYLPYLFLGTPVLLSVLLRGPATKGAIIDAALSVTGAVAMAVVAFGAIREPDMLWTLIFLALISLLFAGLWAATFASLYARLYRAPLL